MTTLFNTAAAALCAAATIMSAASAAAGPVQSHADMDSVRVGYSDLDIGHAAGAQALYLRIRAAATQVCGGMPDISELEQVALFDECRSGAIDRAVAQVHSPLVWTVANRDVHHTIDFASR